MEGIHTFVVCAYGKSAFLEDCVRSLKAQTVASDIIISTSTPNEEIQRVADTFGVPVVVNHGEAGITGDWNFGMSLAKTDLVTIAHQDDIYDPTYAEEVIKKAQKFKRPLLIFTDYYEIKNGEKIYKSSVMKIKKLLNLPIRMFPKFKLARRLALSLGNCICCPAVTYSRLAREDFKFDGKYKFACDWDAWERIGRKKGAFLRVCKPLMGHRIHEDSETSKIMADNKRVAEEYDLFRRFWIKPIAKLISKFYTKGANNNNL